MKKLSVIIPVYNTEEHLAQCLNSVRNQTLTDIEIICVDDGSTDRSLEILKEFQEKDDRMIVVTQKNLHAGVARNRGIEIAQGQYLYFMDSDDFVAPNLLERTYAKAKKGDADIVLFGGKKYDTVTQKFSDTAIYLNKNLLPRSLMCFSRKDVPDTLFQISNPAAWTKLFKRQFVIEEGLQFQNYPNSNDAYFVLTALGAASRITCVDDALVFYRVGQKNNTQSKKASDPLCFLAALKEVRNELIRRGIFAEVEKSWVEATLSNTIYNLNTVNSSAGYIKICRELRTKEMAETGLLLHPAEYYLSLRDFELVKSAASNTIALCTPSERNLTILQHRDSLAQPVVAVVIPVYNVSQYLQACLDSIINQTLQNIEIICINDGSSDNSLNILRENAAKDSRFIILSQNNSGLSAARNAGLAVATGKYVYFMDSDDILAPQALQEMVCLSEDKQLDILFFSGETFYDNEDLQKMYSDLNSQYARKGEYKDVLCGKDMLAALKENNDYAVPAWLQFLRREYLLENQISFREGILHEDNLFMFSMIKAKRTYCIGNIYYLRRVRAGSIMTNKETISNLLGYFLSLVGQLEMAGNETFTREQNQAVLQIIQASAWQVRRLYHTIKPEEQAWMRYCLTQKDYYLFTILVKGETPKYPTNSEIENSRSYKIGRAITYLPRKVRGGIRCLQENGLKYTVLHFFEKIQNKWKHSLHQTRK